MINLEKWTASLIEYEFDEKNSRPAERATREDPGCPSMITLNIEEIEIEINEATANMVQVGKEISFKIEEDITLTDKMGHEFTEHINGVGYGKIKDISSGTGDVGMVYLYIYLEDGIIEES